MKYRIPRFIFVRFNRFRKRETRIVRLNGTPVLSNQDFDKKQFNIYPNPVKEIINLSNITETDFEIYDILGNLVSKGKSQNQINVSSLTQGIYILKLKNGENIFNQKFIKE